MADTIKRQSATVYEHRIGYKSTKNFSDNHGQNIWTYKVIPLHFVISVQMTPPPHFSVENTCKGIIIFKQNNTEWGEGGGEGVKRTTKTEQNIGNYFRSKIFCPRV